MSERAGSAKKQRLEGLPGRRDPHCRRQGAVCLGLCHSLEGDAEDLGGGPLQEEVSRAPRAGLPESAPLPYLKGLIQNQGSGLRALGAILFLLLPVCLCASYLPPLVLNRLVCPARLNSSFLSLGRRVAWTLGCWETGAPRAAVTTGCVLSLGSWTSVRRDPSQGTWVTHS